jgi:hypothetical protein
MLADQCTSARPQRTAQNVVRKVIDSLRLAAETYSAAPPS